MRIKIMLGLMVLLLTACQSVLEKPDNLIYCPEMRSLRCSKIYRPVCGQDKEGQLKTYASDCTACAHVDVVAYHKGRCIGEKQ